VKRSIRVVAAAIAVATAAVAGHAQTSAPAPWPSKPIRMIVTFPPGGSADATVRIVAPKLGERLGQQVVVDNRPGAGGNIGLATLAKSDADGYTLAVGAAGGLAANAALYPKMPFDAQKDFVPISLLAHIPFVLVVPPMSPIKSVADLLAQAKAEPGKVSVGHGGNGTAMHLSVQLLKLLAQVDLTEIAYKGSGPVALDVIGGQVPMLTSSISALMPYVRSGKLRGVAVTSLKRSTVAPEFPTIAESALQNFEVITWFGLLAPAATPKDAVSRLNAEVVQSVSLPAVKEQLTKMGFEIVANTPEQYAVFLREENVKWAKVVRDLGLRAE